MTQSRRPPLIGFF